jgi:hypothetical protein
MTAREVDSLRLIIIYFNIPMLIPGLHSMTESELHCDWRFTAKSIRLGDRPLETHDQFLFPTENLRL